MRKALTRIPSTITTTNKVKNLIHFNNNFINSGSSGSVRHVSQVPQQIVKDKKDLKKEYDIIIVGAGHNGLVSAAYLQKAGYSVCVLEKRYLIGGAAITEEIVDGFKFSRASYLCSLLRPFIISDLKLKEHGLKFYMREPYSSYTPIKEVLWPEYPAKSLLLANTQELICKEIAKFSEKDAIAYPKYEEEMTKFVRVVTSLLDSRPPNIWDPNKGKLSKLKSLRPAFNAAWALGTDLPEFHEMLTSSASKILNKWFESEPLKATLATDALIGTMSGPNSTGTGYVLLHHIMGGIDNKPGAWAYPEGGMGFVSNAIGASAAQLGADIFTRKEVSKITYKKEAESDGTYRATGVVTADGEEIKASKAVFSCCTPHVTFNKLFYFECAKDDIFGHDFHQSINAIDYTSPVTKINVAVNQLPQFLADPGSKNVVQDLHKCTIHLNCESMKELSKSFDTSIHTNVPSPKPMIEMVIPSSLDPTIAPPGAHVVLLFTQYTPYSPSNGSWTDPEFKENYARSVFDIIEEYAPGFKRSIIGKEVLTPVDLERTFGLTGGNIFHGSMSIDQLYWLRPVFSKKCWFPETPMRGLYLCGSGIHPGGGVMGMPGFLAAQAFIENPTKNV